MDRASLQEAIEEIRRAYADAFEEEAEEAPSGWEVVAESLSFHVVLEGALEPDVDVEMLPDALVVRARLEERGGLLRRALLPLPPPFRAAFPDLSFSHGMLFVRITVSRSAP